MTDHNTPIIEQARKLADTTPAGESPSLTVKTARRDWIEDMAQVQYLNGWAAGRRSLFIADRVKSFGDAAAWFALGLAAGFAAALYVIAPAF